MNRPAVFAKSLAEARAAGESDSRRFIAMYRAYLRGANEAAQANYSSESEYGFRLTLAAMLFALLCWAVTMYFVFK